MTAPPATLTLLLGDAGNIPNNQCLPVLIYQRVIPVAEAGTPEDRASWFERTWALHSWKPAWRYGVYDFPHYHSTAHEVLGVYHGPLVTHWLSRARFQPDRIHRSVRGAPLQLQP